MATTDHEEALKAAVAAMGHEFFDVTIICTTDDHQASYWMTLLENGLLLGKGEKKVLAVSEDWDGSGGAGNGLGTLYAWQKACQLAAVKYPGLDLSHELAKGTVSAALYHTAGKGTRMAPLPASENNNKPGVKLPFAVKDGDTLRPITVLEAVIRQTGIYAPTRKGRLSVFWGDQVFLPTAPTHPVPTHHVDILCTLLGDTAPTAEEWLGQGLDKYGVIAVVGTENHDDTSTSTGPPLEAAQVEKVSHETATAMLGSLGQIRQVGPSLGSFSVSSLFLEALCQEFEPELQEKMQKLDTDPHFWMPLTLPEDSYISLMQQKGTDETISKDHYARMQALKVVFLKAAHGTGLGLFGAVDVGKDARWWDYGQLTLYHTNTRLLLEPNNPSADLLRCFLGIHPDTTKSFASVTGDAMIDELSYIFFSKCTNGSMEDSLLSRVAAPIIDAHGAIIVNCASTKSIQAGKGSILYNVIDDMGAGIYAEEGQVVVGVTDETGVTSLLRSRIDIDGGKVWSIQLDGNDGSFEKVHAKNKNANIGDISTKRAVQFDAVADSF